MSITLKDIDAAEGATRNIRRVLDGIGREIHKMREGEELGSQYGFNGYVRAPFSGQHYSGQEGPDWDVGTPIFSLSYYWPRAEADVCVTFPQSWLELDWRALEQSRLDEERRVTEEQLRADTEQAERQQEISERQEYERLKVKYGPA